MLPGGVDWMDAEWSVLAVMVSLLRRLMGPSFDAREFKLSFSSSPNMCASVGTQTVPSTSNG